MRERAACVCEREGETIVTIFRRKVCCAYAGMFASVICACVWVLFEPACALFTLQQTISRIKFMHAHANDRTRK